MLLYDGEDFPAYGLLKVNRPPCLAFEVMIRSISQQRTETVL
jgi:hypothetical protein